MDYSLLKKYKNWKFKNTTLLVISLILLFLFADYAPVKHAISAFGSLGYFGAFLVGIFFVSIFTVAPATVVLFFLAEQHNLIMVSLFAGLGAVIGDYLIFRFLKDRIFNELHYIFNKLGGTYFTKIFSTPYFSWLLPILGAAIIASPLPDEVGISMMGLSKVKNSQFLLISFLLNAIGIFILLKAAESIF